jgi:hypothetical protein
MTGSRVQKSILALIVVLAVAACSTPDAEPQDVPTSAEAPPSPSAVAATEAGDLPTIEPMEQGTFLTSNLQFPAIEELMPPFIDSMYDPGPQGAVDSAYLYLLLASQAYSSGADDIADLTMIHALATDDCEWCRSHEELVTGLVSQNARLTGYELTLSTNAELETYEIEDGGIVCRIPLVSSALRVWNSDGTLAFEDPAREDWYRVEVFYIDGLWRVTEVSQEPVV